jgi:hypothetical protein
VLNKFNLFSLSKINAEGLGTEHQHLENCCLCIKALDHEIYSEKFTDCTVLETLFQIKPKFLKDSPNYNPPLNVLYRATIMRPALLLIYDSIIVHVRVCRIPAHKGTFFAKYISESSRQGSWMVNQIKRKLVVKRKRTGAV